MGAALAANDPARQSQCVFRSIMTAMSHPGRIERIPVSDPSSSLPGCMGDVALALCDFETPIWLDHALNSLPVIDWFRFRTGAPMVDEPSQASFGFVADAAQIPSLDRLALGTDAYPDRSTTLIVTVNRLSNDSGVKLLGPGVSGVTRLDIGDVRASLFAERSALRELFPRGADLVFVCDDLIAALPRTTMVEI